MANCEVSLLGAAGRRWGAGRVLRKYVTAWYIRHRSPRREDHVRGVERRRVERRELLVVARDQRVQHEHPELAVRPGTLVGKLLLVPT